VFSQSWFGIEARVQEGTGVVTRPGWMSIWDYGVVEMWFC